MQHAGGRGEGWSKRVWFDRELLRHQAFLDLGVNSRWILFVFFSKQKWITGPKIKGQRERSYICTNNDELVFTFNEAEELGLCRQTFDRVIDDLVRHGFIDIARDGFGYLRITTLYSVSERWRKYGTPEFEEVQRRKRQQTKPEKARRAYFGRGEGKRSM